MNFSSPSHLQVAATTKNLRRLLKGSAAETAVPLLLAARGVQLAAEAEAEAEAAPPAATPPAVAIRLWAIE